jgi:putative SOS response-associated peptidase YedK
MQQATIKQELSRKDGNVTTTFLISTNEMCVSFTPTGNNQWVKKHFDTNLPAGDYPSEAYPGYLAPLIVKSHLSERVACGLAKFGLIPSWAKDEKISRHTYNARSETVHEKPSYRTAWKQRPYGIALVDHFFEPNYTSGKAQRWRIGLASHEPFGIASIWDTWTDRNTGEWVTSFSMLTVNADLHPVMNQFHKPGDEKRTPIILATHQFNEWLSADSSHAATMMNWTHMPELVCEPF